MKLKTIWWYLSNKDKYHNYVILCWIKAAKKYYLQGKTRGMCYSFSRTIPTIFMKKAPFNLPAEVIRHYISEYYPEYFNTKVIDDPCSCDYEFWWPTSNKESRLKAFDKLIQVYENKLKN